MGHFFDLVAIIVGLEHWDGKGRLHPWKLTWHWKIPIFNRKCVFKWWMFYCHVSFRGGNWVECSTLHPQFSFGSFLIKKKQKWRGWRITWIVEFRNMTLRRVSWTVKCWKMTRFHPLTKDLFRSKGLEFWLIDVDWHWFFKLYKKSYINHPCRFYSWSPLTWNSSHLPSGQAHGKSMNHPSTLASWSEAKSAGRHFLQRSDICRSAANGVEVESLMFVDLCCRLHWKPWWGWNWAWGASTWFEHGTLVVSPDRVSVSWHRNDSVMMMMMMMMMLLLLLLVVVVVVLFSILSLHHDFKAEKPLPHPPTKTYSTQLFGSLPSPCLSFLKRMPR